MSLLQYLSQRLLLLALLVSVGIFYIVYILYQWGMDDSTEYYLQQDMQWAQELLGKEQALPAPTQFKQFYLTSRHSLETLPAIYANVLNENLASPFFFLQDENMFHHGLYQTIDDERVLTVVHQFPINDNAEGISLIEVSILSSLVLILMMLLGAWLIYQRISQSIKILQKAASTDEPMKYKNIGDVELKSEFIEIDNIVNSLSQALKELSHKNQQERLFIQTLSHELRTPMATVQVALELLARKELDDNVTEKLAIIFSSNQKMQNLAQDLLYLWSDTGKEQVQKEKYQSLVLEKEFQQVVAELDQIFHCQQRFTLEPAQGNILATEVNAAKVQVRLLLNNLCKNAIVHSTGKIQVLFHPSEFTICNDKSQQKTDPLVAGAGIGLIIAMRAAELLGWEIQFIETETDYEVRVVMKPARERSE